jgi:hypothetical protein
LRAREEGVDTFTAVMLVDNEQMMDLLERLGAVRVIDRAAGTVDVEVPLPGGRLPLGNHANLVTTAHPARFQAGPHDALGS